ncbi:MAG: HAMP domain-containing histidine kinase [Planctomycetota bacterium]|jgi:signal transduction histidine kinase|nr:HAMP domain-containing histidine kinase [Planctomycetota bacterium]
MILRRKILLFFAVLLVADVLATPFIIAVGGILDPSSRNDTESNWYILAGLIALFAINLLAAYLLVSWSLLAPLAQIVEDADKMVAGKVLLLPNAGQADFFSRLASSFNQLAEDAADIKNNLKTKINNAISETEQSQMEFSIAERQVATGRLAARLANAIRPSLDVIQEGLDKLHVEIPDSSPSQRTVQHCQSGIKRIDNTIREIFNGITTNIETSQVSVGEILRYSLWLAGPQMKKNRITLASDIQDGEAGPLLTLADPGDLQNVFSNLINNSIEAMPRGGSLTVNAYRVQKWIVAEIIDTGIGLTLDELSLSFNFFYSTKNSGPEAGLGLSVARYIMANYGGAITLNSHKGKGTKAMVELQSTEYLRPTNLTHDR